MRPHERRLASELAAQVHPLGKGERVELHPPAVALHRHHLGAAAAMMALQPRNPAVDARQRLGQRSDLAEGATGIGVGDPELVFRILAGMVDRIGGLGLDIAQGQPKTESYRCSARI